MPVSKDIETRPTAADMKAKTGERIAKRMASAGLCSRRDAEKWIAEGRVRVNGELITSPALNVTPQDKILVDDKPLDDKPTDIKLYRYYKPAGLVTTARDPQGRPTVFEALPKQLGRLISIGRLDLNSEGLLLMTNNGDFAQTMMLPATGLKRTYKVRVLGLPTPEKLARLKKGISVQGVRYGRIDVRLPQKSPKGKNVWLEVTLAEGKNREIRNVFKHLGHPVNRLLRLSYGPFRLGKLNKGEVAEVPHHMLEKFLKELS